MTAGPVACFYGVTRPARWSRPYPMNARASSPPRPPRGASKGTRRPRGPGRDWKTITRHGGEASGLAIAEEASVSVGPERPAAARRPSSPAPASLAARACRRTTSVLLSAGRGFREGIDSVKYPMTAACRIAKEKCGHRDLRAVPAFQQAARCPCGLPPLIGRTRVTASFGPPRGAVRSREGPRAAQRSSPPTSARSPALDRSPR